MRCLNSFSRLTRSSSSLFRLAMILACGSEIVAKSKVSTCSDIVVDKQTGHGALHSFLKVLFIFGISFESQPFTHTSQIEMQQGASASRCHRLERHTERAPHLVLPCGHRVFCTECLDECLRRSNRTCPLGRRPVCRQ